MEIFIYLRFGASYPEIIPRKLTVRFIMEVSSKCDMFNDLETPPLFLIQNMSEDFINDLLLFGDTPDLGLNQQIYR